MEKYQFYGAQFPHQNFLTLVFITLVWTIILLITSILVWDTGAITTLEVRAAHTLSFRHTIYKLEVVQSNVGLKNQCPINDTDHKINQNYKYKIIVIKLYRLTLLIQCIDVEMCTITSAGPCIPLKNSIKFLSFPTLTKF